MDATPARNGAARTAPQIRLSTSGELGSDIGGHHLRELRRRTAGQSTERTVDYPWQEHDLDGEDQRKEHHEPDATAPIKTPIPEWRPDIGPGLISDPRTYSQFPTRSQCAAVRPRRARSCAERA
jgi:hypothetical protein